RHAEEGGEQVGEADDDGLKRTRDVAEAGGAENVVGVIEDGVDARKLVEEADRDSQEDGKAVTAGEERLRRHAAVEVDRVDGAEDGGASDSEAADKPEGEQRGPAPGEGAAEGGDGVENSHDAESFATPDTLAEHAGSHGADDGSDEADEDGDAERERGEVVD